jgi:hypothetical protein
VLVTRASSMSAFVVQSICRRSSGGFMFVFGVVRRISGTVGVVIIRVLV